MRRFYQESWQGIPFTALSHLSFFHLAEPRFYSIFYEELFRRYKNWNNLPEKWRKSKNWDAEWLAEQIRVAKAHKREGQFSVLSIGSGVGYMEKMLLEKIPDLDLHINEPSTVGMKWLRAIVPNECIYIGKPMECLPSDIFYDLIYLSAVDYSIPQPEFLRLLEMLRGLLKEDGEMICISASLLEEYSLIGGIVNSMKIIIRCFLHYMGIRRQQFWGWRRTREEYRATFANAELTNITDGFLDDGFDSYWIRGCK